jgi:hypothetical protein
MFLQRRELYLALNKRIPMTSPGDIKKQFKKFYGPSKMDHFWNIFRSSLPEMRADSVFLFSKGGESDILWFLLQTGIKTG